MPRTLLITENAPVPSDRRVWNEACALRDAGWDVVVVCARGRDRDNAPVEVRDGIEIHRFPLEPASGGLRGYAREYLQALWRIRRTVRRLARTCDFDVVHAGNPPDFLLLAARSLRRRGARFVFDHHDLVPELYRSKYGSGPLARVLAAAVAAAERLAFSLADVVVCTNESYRAVAVGRGRCDPSSVFVVRNGPDLERFRPVPPQPALKRGRTHLIGYLGIMGPQDGVDHAIRALARLRERRDDWHAVLIGEGETRDEMEALAGGLGIAEHVEFAGWRYDDDIRAILSTCDVCLAPDPPSPLNDVSTMIKIPEYMAMGCPVVSYDLTESRVSAGEAAVYATPGDPDDLGARLDELLADPARRAEMAEAGRRRVRDALSWQHSVPLLLAAYARATAGQPARRGARYSTVTVLARFLG